MERRTVRWPLGGLKGRLCATTIVGGAARKNFQYEPGPAPNAGTHNAGNHDDVECAIPWSSFGQRSMQQTTPRQAGRGETDAACQWP
jgi:hypothetical protein